MLKKIPVSKQLTRSHINSGFTSGRDPVVAVYRAEECHKVLIHELMHFGTYMDTIQIWNYRRTYPEGAVVETYVETIATVCCAYCSGDVDSVKSGFPTKRFIEKNAGQNRTM
jgi:hypothetical protein